MSESTSNENGVALLRLVMQRLGLDWKIGDVGASIDIVARTVPAPISDDEEEICRIAARVLTARLRWALDFAPEIPADKGGFAAEEMITDCLTETTNTIARALLRSGITKGV